MRAFSTDLRQRILDAALKGDTTEQAVAHRFGVSRGFVQKIKRRWRAAGTAEPVAQRRGPTPRISDDDRTALAGRVAATPDATDDEHRAWLAAERGVAVSVSTVNRTLLRQPDAAPDGADAQKKELRADERDRPDVAAERAAFAEAQPSLDADRFVFLDETGSNVAMTRRYGRSPRGQRVYGSVPHRRGKNLTVIGAVSAAGVVCHQTLDGGVRGETFLAFVEGVLLPALRPGQVVVMDPPPTAAVLSSHKTRAVRAAFAAAGIGVRYLPRYSPEWNPTELCWSKVKT